MRNERGFTLVEVVICGGLLATLAAGGAHLIGRAVHDAEAARTRTVAAVAAQQKMEQLRALAWDVDADFETDLAGNLPAAGGAGLQFSPSGTLNDDVAGHVDYLDGDGEWLSGTSSVSAVFARRWSVAPHPERPQVLALRVVVTRARGPMRRGAGGAALLDVEQASFRARFQP